MPFCLGGFDVIHYVGLIEPRYRLLRKEYSRAGREAYRSSMFDGCSIS